jgi:hypothetical protein
MRHVHSTNEISKSRRKDIELQVRPEVYNEGYNGTQFTFIPNPMTMLDASLMDPFFKYPVDMGYRERELYNHLYDETCIMFRTMRDIGFLNLIRDTPAFLQLLSMSSWHLDHLNTSYEANDYLSYSFKSIKRLRNELAVSNQYPTDAAIATLLVFVASSVWFPQTSTKCRN